MQTLLVFGSTGTGKTVICGKFARYQAMKHRAPTLYCGADSGWESAGDEVREGLMDPYNLASHPDALWALRRIGRGMWPRKINVNGVAENPSDFISLQIHPRYKDTGISGIAVEGLFRNAELISTQMVNEMEGFSTGEKLVSQFRINSKGQITTPTDKGGFQSTELDDEEMFAMPSRSTYNFIQQQTAAYVNVFKGHPSAPRILFTSHQIEGKSSEGNARVLGPAIYGRAGVDKAPGWFGSYFHAQTIPAGILGPQEMKALWYQWHTDQALGLPWPSKLGVPSSIMAQFRNTYPGGYVPSVIDPNGNVIGGIESILMALDSGGSAL